MIRSNKRKRKNKYRLIYERRKFQLSLVVSSFAIRFYDEDEREGRQLIAEARAES